MRAASNAIVIWTLALALTGAPPEPALAQGGWNPFSSPVQQAPGRPPQEAAPSPADSAYVRVSPWQSPRGGSVERGELAPILAPDASGLPLELWQGLNLSALEGLFAGLALPPRSFALHQLWRRMLLSSASPPEGSDQQHFAALRLEALYRSGLIEE